MIRQDYIMRMIEQLISVLSKIGINKEAGKYQEAITNIETAFKNILGLDYILLNALSAKDIISLMKISNDYTTLNIKCIIIAKLLKEKTKINKQLNVENPSSINDYQKPLILYLEGIVNNNLDIELGNYYADVLEIVTKINDSEISQDTRFKLFKFYELIGEYDKAENERLKLKGTNNPKS